MTGSSSSSSTLLFSPDTFQLFFLHRSSALLSHVAYYAAFSLSQLSWHSSAFYDTRQSPGRSTSTGSCYDFLCTSFYDSPFSLPLLSAVPAKSRRDLILTFRAGVCREIISSVVLGELSLGVPNKTKQNKWTAFATRQTTEYPTFGTHKT